MSLKLVPAALLLFVFVAVGMGHVARNADADVAGPFNPAGPITLASGAPPAPITIPLTAPPDADDIIITTIGLDTSPANLTGTLRLLGCIPSCAGDLPQSTTSDATPLTVATDDQTQVIVDIALTCTVDSSVTVIAYSGGGADVESIIVNCTAPEPTPTGGSGLVGNFGQIAATATPNLLPCEGGTAVIDADVVDQLGNLLGDATFRFETTAGTIVQVDSDTAKLTLGPNQIAATVTVKIADPVDEEVESGQVVVSLACNNTGTQTLVVTASPNVIDCTGTSTITASVRDANGHVVPGRGFHFVTSAGLLTVDPNNANTEEGTATLKLRPGDGNATVVVASGGLYGTYQELEGTKTVTGNGDVVEVPGVEEHFVDGENPSVQDSVVQTALVTVQQNCLSTTTGQIKVNSSSINIACGERVFIGLSVIDEDLKTVIDNTPLTLIATAGGFFGGEGVLLSAAQVPTSHGEANTIYTAPANFNGEVKITAASGDAYGFEKLNVSCVVPATSTGTGAAPCIDIGDGVCITPPNTGRNSITPPNTGSAGLK